MLVMLSFLLAVVFSFLEHSQQYDFLMLLCSWVALLIAYVALVAEYDKTYKGLIEIDEAIQNEKHRSSYSAGFLINQYHLLKLVDKYNNTKFWFQPAK